MGKISEIDIGNKKGLRQNTVVLFKCPFINRRKEFNNASIKQIKDGIIQSGIFYRRTVYPVPHGEQSIS